MNALSLNDSRWTELRHAYGPAADIPELLGQLDGGPMPQDPAEEPWFSLWSALCHQGDVYTASYAALPHLVAEAARISAARRTLHFHLPASIAALSGGKRSPAIPGYLVEAFEGATRHLGELALETLRVLPVAEEEELATLLGVVAISRGQTPLGNMLLQRTTKLECPECGAEVTSYGYALEH